MKKFALIMLAVSIGSLQLVAQNYALKFNANSNLVTIGKPDYSGKNWTVELWAKRTADTQHATFLNGTGGKLNLESWNNTHKVGFKNNSGGGDVTFDYILPLNTWAHVAYVYSNGSLSLYANGELKGTKTTTMGMPMTSIGLGTESFVGELDEIRLWKTSRTPAQLADNMNKSVNPMTETNLMAYWYFDDRATTMTDLSSTGSVGVISGATYVLNNNNAFTSSLPKMELMGVSCSHDNEYYMLSGATDQELLCIQVQTQGVQDPIKLTEINITTEGTTDISDLENISVYYTKSSSEFAVSHPVEAKVTPQNTLKFSQEITLMPGTNYFWVAADLKPSAVDGHVVDAGLASVVLNGQSYSPELQNPTGRRLIKTAEDAYDMPYVSIIPRPNTQVIRSDKFTLNAQTVILVSPEVQKEGEFLASFLKNATGYDLTVSPLTDAAVAIPNSISLKIEAESTALADEAYTLVSSTDNIVITAKKPVGAFWGIQTLRQMLPPKIESKTAIADYVWTIPAASISDAPRFEYRGVMFDPSRHFFSVEFTKKYIDLLSLYKINYFHWHLTDDQGWRIEIKRYPKLQSIGAWRECGTGLYGSPDGSRYGGYYTQEEIKEVVAYAAERHVEIIPEIEIPGHSLAIIAAYPELACTSGSGSYKVACTGGIFADIICGGNDSTVAVFKHIFDEVMELFPSKYVHIGGDEAPKTRWKACSRCQAKITELGFVDEPNSNKEEKLQRYIIDEVGAYLMSKGKEYIGWTEVAHSGVLPTGIVLQDWQGGMDLAVNTGHKVIRSSYSRAMYIAQRQSDDPSEPSGPGNITTLEQTYAYEPVPSNFTAAQEALILGPEACLWTEHVTTDSHAEYMTSPRMQAVAEIGWSRKNQRNITTFKKNMLPQFVRLNEMNSNYRRFETSAAVTVVIEKAITGPTVISSTVDGLSYFWNDADFSSSKSITVSETGTYKCYVDYYGVQSLVIYKVVNTASGLQAAKSDNVGMLVRPNPAKENVTVSLELKNGQGGAIKLITAQGNLVEEKFFAENKTEKSFKLNNLPKGMYLIQVSTQDGDSTQKLLVE